jgi:hypothetical protein
MKSPRGGSAILLLVAVAAVGCSGHQQEHRPPKLVPVHGVVRLSGKPVDGARVDFFNTASDQPSASGMTDAEGKFRLTTYADGDGAVPGKYRVAVTKAQDAGRHEEKTAPPSFRLGGAPRPRWLIPQHYSNPATSDLQADVTDGENPEIVFDLKG